MVGKGKTMIEIWKDVIGYEGFYQVSNLGRVRSLDRYVLNKFVKGKILTPKTDKDGYLQICLYNNGRKYYRIHRLVAQTFIPNHSNFPEINHKNEIKTDNRVENLEWCTTQYNSSYGSRAEKIIETRNKKELKKAEKPVIMLTLEGKPINEYKSISEASRKNNISLGNLWSVLNGRLKHTGGYCWKYKKI